MGGYLANLDHSMVLGDQQNQSNFQDEFSESYIYMNEHDEPLDVSTLAK